MTDARGLAGRRPEEGSTRLFGHEFTGTVTNTADESSGIEPGMRVVSLGGIRACVRFVSSLAQCRRCRQQSERKEPAEQALFAWS